MRILAVSDEECAALWDCYVPGRLADFDLILSCGDLKAAYLEFLVTMGRARLLYVRGNHDGSYLSAPPEGCDDIDGHLVIFNGVRILGLGGCLRYHPGPCQYSEREMRARISSLRRALKKSGGVDIVVTHAPPRGIGDMHDPAHTGFEAFVELIDRYRPALFLHGHTHMRYDYSAVRVLRRGDTDVVNVSERYAFDFPDRDVPPERRNELVRITRYREPEPDTHMDFPPSPLIRPF